MTKVKIKLSKTALDELVDVYEKPDWDRKHQWNKKLTLDSLDEDELCSLNAREIDLINAMDKLELINDLLNKSIFDIEVTTD
jgi:hypothetical protein